MVFKKLLNVKRPLTIAISGLNASFGNVLVSIIAARSANNISEFADFAAAFLLYTLVITASRVFITEPIRINIVKKNLHTQYLNIFTDISMISIFLATALIFVDIQIGMKTILLFSPFLIIHDLWRYIYISYHRYKCLLIHDSVWNVLFLLLVLFLEMTNTFNIERLIIVWCIPTVVTTVLAVFGVRKYLRCYSRLKLFQWIKDHSYFIFLNGFEFIIGNGFWLLVILKSFQKSTETDVGSFRIAQIILFPIYLFQSVNIFQAFDHNAQNISTNVSELGKKIKFQLATNFIIGFICWIMAPYFLRIIWEYDSPFSYTIGLLIFFNLLVTVTQLDLINKMRNRGDIKLIALNRIFPLIVTLLLIYFFENDLVHILQYWLVNTLVFSCSLSFFERRRRSGNLHRLRV